MQDNVPILKEILDTVETFVGSLDKFIGVFDESYEGGDFCAGITFGMQGIEMLEQVAKKLYEDHIKFKAQHARNHAPDRIANRLKSIIDTGESQNGDDEKVSQKDIDESHKKSMEKFKKKKDNFEKFDPSDTSKFSVTKLNEGTPGG